MIKARFWGGLVGIVLGFLSANIFLIGWLNLIIWGIVGLVVGFAYRDTRKAKWAGGFYGFFLTISFLLLGFRGASDKLFMFVLFSLGLSIIGIFCGLILAIIGNRINYLRSHHL